MERRTFIATTGTGVGIGIAGCLNADDGSSGENGTTELEGDRTETTDGETDDNDGDTERSNTETDDTDDADQGGETTVPATFEVASMETNSPIGGGELLEVSATIENVGDETGTTDVDLVVGHDPVIEDSEMLTLEPGESVDIALEFRAGEPAGDTEAFPVRVDTGAHEVSETIVVGEDDGGGDPGEDVTFDSCERATVSGTFEDGDVAYASTGFYDEAGFGNTIIEDGITVGDDVAPFTGTIVFEVSDEQAGSESVDGIVITVPDYGEYGTVITGLTTDRDDYMGAGVTHGNPHAEACLEEIESEWEDDTGQNGDPTPATFEVASMTTNSPVGGGELLEVSATIENVGDETGTTDVDLVVGHDPAIEDSRMLTLEPGESVDIALEFRAGEPAGDTETFPVRVDTGAHEASETVVVQ